MAEGVSDNLMDYNDSGTRLHKYQWDFIHNPEGGLYVFQDEEEGAYKPINWLSSIIEEIRCARISETGHYNLSNYSVLKNEIIEDNTVSVIGKNFTRIVANLKDKSQSSIDVSKIELEGPSVFVGGKESGLKLTVYNQNLYEDNEAALWLRDYLTVGKKRYKGQVNTLLVEIARASYDKMIADLLQLPGCVLSSLSAEWRFLFLEKIMKQDGTLTDREAICINQLFSTVEDEGQASLLITSIKENAYDIQMIKTITNMRSTAFSNIANGLAWLYYAQNKQKVIEAGQNVNAENFYAWEPYGNVREKYKAAANNPELSTFFDWLYNSRTYSYTVHLEDDGRFRVHAHGVEFSHAGSADYHSDFYISPFETVSVYFASKNKYVNIEDYTIVMPGILFAWIIDQGDRETNQMLVDIGITAASFYIGGSAIVKATGNVGKIISTVLFAKGLADKILSSPEVLNILVKKDGDKGDVFIKKYKDLSKIIDCGLIFKNFADNAFMSFISY